MTVDDLKCLQDVELDLTNLLMSFGVTQEQATEIDKMIEVTLDNHLKIQETNER